ncbi:spore cortex biosynthesis protein YabQ [Falsibacillus pallidus]|uniref:Spore cortex biosynthesis protein YabQ n=1 Tax=Falsibacillus pallidus TaxID=493781 RepID=A0A370G6E0_9BACI|nr:spore cortex biosynthesis protein YabQ [Falsibacillus pallidus]
MTMSLTTQFCTMLAMIAMGSFFGAALDTYSRFLKRNKRKRWLVFINDVLFWVMYGLFTFYILYKVNFGEVRFYIFIAILCGFAAYQALFKKAYLKLLEIFIRMTIKIYLMIVKTIQLMLVRPVTWIFFTLTTIVFTLLKGIWTLVKALLKILLWLLKIFLAPIFWMMKIFWKLMPKKIKKSVEKLYNYLAGKWKRVKNYINNKISFWKKRE